MNDAGELFHEEQRFRQPLLLVALAVPALVLGVVIVTARAPLGVVLVPALVVVAVAVMMTTARLVVVVRTGRVLVQFRPFHRRPRIVDLDHVESHAAVTYSPLAEYGGYGIRGFSSKRAYNASGDRGVRLVFRDGKRLLIGSQRADELDAAIARAKTR